MLAPFGNINESRENETNMKPTECTDKQAIVKNEIYDNDKMSVNIEPQAEYTISKNIQSTEKIHSQLSVKEIEDENNNRHLQRILKHVKHPDQLQRYIEIYNLIVSPELPRDLIILNQLNKPLPKQVYEDVAERRKTFPFMPTRYFELSMCKILPPLYYMIPTDDLFNVEFPKYLLPKRKKMKTPFKTQRNTIKRQFKCAIESCDKTYTSAYGLKYHEANGHLEDTASLNDEYVFRCELEGCKKSYKQKNGLRYHLKKTHNIEILPSSNSAGQTQSLEEKNN
ncbi:Zinc finger C2H2 protein [Cucumispora dikerogammari]|nr:Zinc finger C2H2 protein [Cucumispora dikerogammari]